MADDAIQGMLFAGRGETTVDDSIAERELRLCALNVNSANFARAQRLVDWLLGSECNVLVLTEMRPTDGGHLIRASLDAEGFQITSTRGWRDSRFHTAVASKGFDVTPVQPSAFDPRIVAADLTSAGGSVRLVGMYGLTNGMTAESSQRRQEFQQQALAYLAAIHQPNLCVAGDLNVVEPDHRPPLPAFEAHDYAFYSGLLGLGLRDAYRLGQPAGNDHSWFSPRFGNQRLDHTLVGQSAGIVQDCIYDHSPWRQELTDHAALRAVLRLRT